MDMGLVSVAATVCVTLATRDLTVLCLTSPTLTSSRRTLKVYQHADATENTEKKKPTTTHFTIYSK